MIYSCNYFQDIFPCLLKIQFPNKWGRGLSNQLILGHMPALAQGRTGHLFQLSYQTPVSLKLQILSHSILKTGCEVSAVSVIQTKK